MLTNAEVLELIRQFKENDDAEARNKIITENLKFVYNIAYKYRKNATLNHASFEDLVEDGVIGLIEAVDKFDPSHNVKFFTYAYFWVLKRITENITIGTLELPFHRSYAYQKFRKMADKAEENGEQVDVEQICEDLGISQKILIDTINKKDYITREDNDERQGSDVSKECKINEAMLTKDKLENRIIDGVVLKKVKHLIKTKLDERSQKVLYARYGLDNKTPKTLCETSKTLGVSPEYVRVIENKAIKKLSKLVKK